MVDINKVRSVVKLKDLLKDGFVKTGEPQKAYMFEIEIIDNIDNESFNNLKYYVKDVTIPARSKEKIVVELVGSKVGWAGKDDSSRGLNITFWDDEDLTMTHFTNAWYQLSGDWVYDNAVEKSAFTRDIKVIMKPTIDIGSTGTFLFKGCYPSEIGEITLSYEESSIMEFSTTFSFDYMEVIDADENAIKSLVDLYGAVKGTQATIDKLGNIF